MVVMDKDVVADLSRLIQIICYLWILWRCRQIILHMPYVEGWPTIWNAFVIGFVALLATPTITLMSDWFGVLYAWPPWIFRLVTPVLASLAFLLSIELLYRWMSHTPAVHPEFYVPPPAHISINADSQILAWDIEAERLFGWLADECIGVSILDRVIPEWLHNTHLNAITAFLLKGDTAQLKPSYPTTARNRAGVEFPVEITLQAITGESGIVFESTIRRMRY